MAAETTSERQLICTQITEALTSGAIDRVELHNMVKTLTGLAHDLSWDVKAQLRGRNDTPAMQQAGRLVSSAQGSLSWAEKHAQYALTFELARCVEIANGAALKVMECLQLEGVAA